MARNRFPLVSERNDVKRTARLGLGILLALSLVAAGCGDDEDDDAASSGSDEEIVIAAQKFSESAILAEIYKQGLAAKGFDTSIKALGGFREIEIPAFEGGEVNFAPEYAASMLEFINNKGGEASADVDATVEKLQTRLSEIGLAAFDVSEAVNTNGFAITKATSDRLGIKNLSDLATKGASLRLGGPADCPTNPFCLRGLQQTYGVNLSANFRALEGAPRYAALKANEIDISVVFTTDGALTDDDFVVLVDDKELFSADNVIPVTTADLSENDDLADAANAITAELTTQLLTEMNKRFDIDKEDAADIAHDFLEDANLI
jgi:osmoprotectant transport system substrate-binding protein